MTLMATTARTNINAGVNSKILLLTKSNDNNDNKIILITDKRMIGVAITKAVKAMTMLIAMRILKSDNYDNNTNNSDTCDVRV